MAALDDAAQTTLDIREVMTQAELDVAAIFRERDAGGAGKGKGLASGAAPQLPWDADGFGWWADQFNLQHGRAPTDADYAEFQLSWKLSGEGKVQWTDADWEAFYEARLLGLDAYLAKGFWSNIPISGRDLLDIMKDNRLSYFPPVMAYAKNGLKTAPDLRDEPEEGNRYKSQLYDDINNTALGAAIFNNQPALWNKLDIRIQILSPGHAVSFPDENGKYLIALPPRPDPINNSREYKIWVAIAGHEVFHAYQREIALNDDVRKKEFTDLAFEREAYIAQTVFEYELGIVNYAEQSAFVKKLINSSSTAKSAILPRDSYNIYAEAPEGIYHDFGWYGFPLQVTNDLQTILAPPTPTSTPTDTSTPSPTPTLTDTPTPSQPPSPKPGNTP